MKSTIILPKKAFLLSEDKIPFFYRKRNTLFSFFCQRKKRREKTETRKALFPGRRFHWLGYLDSNQGITVSETVVLPLDYIPRAKRSIENTEGFVKKKLLVVSLAAADLKRPVHLLQGQEQREIVGECHRGERKRIIRPLSQPVAKSIGGAE